MVMRFGADVSEDEGRAGGVGSYSMGFLVFWKSGASKVAECQNARTRPKKNFWRSGKILLEISRTTLYTLNIRTF
jgi:hypothetical protein